ncbi:MAG: laccase domain-containing protein [Ruminococcus sp.]
MKKERRHNENKLHMQVKENNGVTYLTYPSFEQFPDIVHCFSTRLGGVSQGIFSSMNLSFTRGDEENAVKDDYIAELSAAVGFSDRILSTS